jgi:hypothetical protein
MKTLISSFSLSSFSFLTCRFPLLELHNHQSFWSSFKSFHSSWFPFSWLFWIIFATPYFLSSAHCFPFSGLICSTLHILKKQRQVILWSESLRMLCSVCRLNRNQFRHLMSRHPKHKKQFRWAAGVLVFFKYWVLCYTSSHLNPIATPIMKREHNVHCWPLNHAALYKSLHWKMIHRMTASGNVRQTCNCKLVYVIIIIYD